MVSPGPALSMAARKEPGPLSLVFITVNVLPNAGDDDNSTARYGRDLATKAWNNFPFASLLKMHSSGTGRPTLLRW